MQAKIQIFKTMTSATENKDLIPTKNLPRTGDSPQKVESGRVSGFKTGALLAGGAVLGCFALALWNRKALTALLKNRGLRNEPAPANPQPDDDAIY